MSASIARHNNKNGCWYIEKQENVYQIDTINEPFRMIELMSSLTNLEKTKFTQNQNYQIGQTIFFRDFVEFFFSGKIKIKTKYKFHSCQQNVLLH